MRDLILRGRIALERARERHGKPFVLSAKTAGTNWITGAPYGSVFWIRSLDPVSDGKTTIAKVFGHAFRTRAAYAADQKTSVLTAVPKPSGADLQYIVHSGAGDNTTLAAAAALGPFFNVQDAANAGGAVGDGTTNDYTAIQTTINNASALGIVGAVVFFPPAIYLIGTGLVVNHSGINLMGCGISASLILVAAASTFDAVTITSTSGNSAVLGTYLVGCGVSHLAIRRQAATASTAIGLKVTYTMYTTIEDVYLYNWGTSFYISAGLNNLVNQVRATGFQNAISGTMVGFHLSGTQGPMDTIRMFQCAFQYDYPQAAGAVGGTVNSSGGSIGWLMDSGIVQDVMITDCECDNAQTYSLKLIGQTSGSGATDFDVHFYNFAAGDGAPVLIQDCIAAQGGSIDFDGGIYTNTSAFIITNSSGVCIRGMQFLGNTTGISISGGSTGIIVTGCVVYGATSAFVTIANASFITVSNNFLSGSGTGVLIRSTGGAVTSVSVMGNIMNGITKGVDIGSGNSAITCVGNAWGGASNYTDTPASNSFANNV